MTEETPFVQCRFVTDTGWRCARTVPDHLTTHVLFCFQHLNLVASLLKDPIHVWGPEWMLIKRSHYDELRNRTVDAEIAAHELKRRIVRRERNQRITPAVRAAIIARDGGLCRYCGCEVGPAGVHLDHYEPDGPTDPTNLVTSCRECNIRKGPIRPRHLFKQRGMKLRGKGVQSPPIIPA